MCLLRTFHLERILPYDACTLTTFSRSGEGRHSWIETDRPRNRTWRAALDWDVTDDNFLFASVQTGFKSGGFFFSNDSQVFQPEELEAFTLGSRNRLFGDRLQLDVEAFHWRYKDQQVSTITLDSLMRDQPGHPQRR